MVSNDNIMTCNIGELAGWKYGEAFGYFKRGTVNHKNNEVDVMSAGILIMEQSCAARAYIFKRLHKALKTS